MSNSQLKTVKEFMRLQQDIAGYFTAQTAARVGILAALDSGQKTASELSSQLSLDPAATELLLVALCETGIAEHYGDLYALSPASRMIADKLTLGAEHWSHLEQFVREGIRHGERNGQPQGEAHSADSDLTSATLFERHAWMQTPAAMDAAEVLDFGRSRRAFRVLELGGHQAIFSAALAHRDPDSRITVLDHSDSLQRARETVGSVGLQNQFDFVAGDWRHPELAGEPFDLVLIVGRMHGTDEETCRGLINQIASSLLLPTAELVVVDVFRGQPEGSRTVAFYELELGLSQRATLMHRPQSIRNWMQAAGLTQVRYAHLPSPPHVWGLILAQRG